MGLFTTDKKKDIEKLKGRIEQEKSKIKSCQTNIAEYRRRGGSSMKMYIDGQKKRIEEIKRNIVKLKEEIARIKAK